MKDIELFFQTAGFDPYLLYDAIVRSTDDYVYIGDLTKNSFLVTPNMVRDFNLPGERVEDLIPVWGELIHEKDQAMYYDSIDRMLSGETDEHNAEYQIRNRKNEYVWVHCRGILKRDSQGEPAFFAGVVTNLGKKGKVDFITGLFTQPECEKRVNAMFQKNTEAHGGIIMLGLDNFTRINNLNNHIFGDSVLRRFAQDIQSILPESAWMYRFDGDQFAILYECPMKKMLYDLYLQIHAYANRQHEIDGLYYFCTVSAGIAVFPQDADNFLDLVKYATSALEESKKKGKNICTYFSQKLMQHKLRTMEISELLQKSVLHGFERFHLAYQPLTDAKSMRINGAEVLLRWDCDHYGAVPPLEFIPILEENELISSVGKWVLDKAVATCKEWSLVLPDFVMNINVSYLQMLDTGFSSFVQNTLDKYGLDPSHIVLELTESHFVTDMNFLKDTFRRLRDIPIQIAMDDFGTGYSSLGMLAQSPADVVKIDRVFVQSLRETEFNRSFIGAVVQLCHSVGIRVCVEGVEENSDLVTMQSLKVDSIQGFYISKPISKEEFTEKYIHAKALTQSGG